jgi:predicted Zn finger-like uncharacterized protein
MSHLTRCPVCATTFRVVDDQLKLADGWVRCGSCQHVYDALPGLQDEPPPPPVAEAPVPLRADPADATHKPTFVRQAERRALWRRPGVRWGLAASTLVAGLALGLQAAWLWRDTVSVRWPVTQPWLQQLCQPLACRVSAPRLPQALSIDSSALMRGDNDRYTFDLVVKNRQPHAVAAPALELTLLDEGQAVRLRRVLPAHEWPGARESLAAGAEWPVRFELALDPAIAVAMSGYRAVLFYP